MSTKKTHVALVLDRSGSMSSIRDEIIDAFNEQLDVIQREGYLGGETTISFVTFGGWYEGRGRRGTVPHIPVTSKLPQSVHPDTTASRKGNPIQVLARALSPDEITPLGPDSYSTVGLTPMYDGVGYAINILEDLDDGGDDTAFLVVVLSDGQENHSQEWSKSQIADKISDLQETDRWTFVYIGADHNLANEAEHLGLTPGNVGTFDPNAAGVRSLARTMAGSTVSYMAARNDGKTSVGSYADEIEKETA